MFKRIVFKWILRWITLHDIVYLVKTIMRRDSIKVIKIEDDIGYKILTGDFHWVKKKEP